MRLLASHPFEAFLERAERLKRSPSLRTAMSATRAAALAWAEIYAASMSVHAFPKGRLNTFHARLRTARRAIKPIKPSPDLIRLGKRLDWYTTLVEALRDGGPDRAAHLIDERLREPE